MEALITNVDWLAVGVSTIICYLFASLWFSSWLFGEKWADGVGVENGTSATRARWICSKETGGMTRWGLAAA